MKLPETLFGYPRKIIRDLFKEHRDPYLWNLGSIKAILHINKKEAIRLLKIFEEEGYIRPEVHPYNKSRYFKNTIKGNALANASLSPRVTREKAEKVLKDLMGRIEIVNADDKYMYHVNQAAVFGSYLNKDDTDLGDVDVAIELKRKIEDNEEWEKRTNLKVKEETDRGRTFSTWTKMLFWPEHEVLFFLKNRCRVISLHYYEEISCMAAEGKVNLSPLDIKRYYVH